MLREDDKRRIKEIIERDYQGINIHFDPEFESKASHQIESATLLSKSKGLESIFIVYTFYKNNQEFNYLVIVMHYPDIDPLFAVMKELNEHIRKQLKIKHYPL